MAGGGKGVPGAREAESVEPRCSTGGEEGRMGQAGAGGRRQGEAIGGNGSDGRRGSVPAGARRAG